MWRDDAASFKAHGTEGGKPQRQLRYGLSTLMALSLAVLPSACSENSSPGPTTGGRKATGGAKTGGSQATGGNVSSGGVTGTGGTTTTGGNMLTGGSKPSGGTTSSGGSVSQGGAQSGGAVTTGGAANSGGTPTTGGISGSGGTPVTGGAKTGGAPAAGGAPGTGGTPIVITPAEGDQWVSPTGDDANAGTEAKPLKNLQTAVLKAQPGTTIWMMAGTHSYVGRVGIKSPTVNLTMGTRDQTAPVVGNARDGQPGKPIRIFGVAGSRPVIDFAQQRKIINDMAAADCSAGPNAAAPAVGARNVSRGISLYAEYWHLKNLEISNAADNCIYVAGSHNIIEDLLIHDCGDTGLQITGQDESSVYLPSYNKILNCDSYANNDDLICETQPGEDADGYAAKLAIGPGNEFHGCRAFGNVDDGWDFFAGKMAQPPVTMDNCWVFGQRHPSGTTNGDGNGFKLGGWRNESDRCIASLNTANHKLSNLFAFDNPGWGFDMNNNTAKMTCDKCGAWNNGCKTQPKCNKNFEVMEIECGSFGLTITNEVTGLSLTADKAKAAKRDANGNLPDIRTL